MRGLARRSSTHLAQSFHPCAQVQVKISSRDVLPKAYSSLRILGPLLIPEKPSFFLPNLCNETLVGLECLKARGFKVRPESLLDVLMHHARLRHRLRHMHDNLLTRGGTALKNPGLGLKMQLDASSSMTGMRGLNSLDSGSV